MKAPTLLVLLSGLITSSPSALAGQEPLTQNVRLTFHLIEANGFREADPAIADIVTELRQVFRFEGYRRLDTSVLRGTLAGAPRGTEAEVFTVVRQHSSIQGHGAFEIEAWIYRTPDPMAVRVIVRLRDEERAYFSSSGQRLLPVVIDASVTTRSGQTVVLGSGRPEGAAGALILAMSVQVDED